jgi:capsular polysaccharide biosynthesis protein
MEDLVDWAERQGLNWLLIDDLAEVDFDDQMFIFSQVDVLVAVAGTALHNMLFMRPGSAVVIIMQPFWCGKKIYIFFIV